MASLDKTPPVIAGIIVNYRTADLVIAGLNALLLERKQFPGLHLVVVDNDSGDGSFERLQQGAADYSDWVKVVAASKNGGYAYGNNYGFTEAKAWLQHIDYFWMLNPDTEVLPGATAALLGFLEENPRTIVGSCLQDRDGTKQVSTFNFPSVVGEMCAGFGLSVLDKVFKNRLICRQIPQKNERTDWLAGASLMFSAAVQQELGGLDEVYFLYFEEVDYLLHAHRRGIHCWYIPSSRIVHEVGASTGISDVRKQQPRRPQYWFASRRRYYIKNHSRFYLLCVDMAWIGGYSSWLARKWLTRREEFSAQPPHLLCDFILASDFNPCNWSKRS
ncbi:MAG: glycosyltransferase family 2 protein [Cellvibrionaceae bacterium]|nr:glycosyltransferase family 2 protein [Cellvibrionaceae bacterium]